MSIDPKPEGEPPENREVVRLTTSWWSDRRGAHMKRSLVTLKRLSTGFQLLSDECSAVGTDEALGSIVNLHECGDGLYVVKTCNDSRDYETGHIDGYDLKLIPFTEKAP